MSFSPAHSEEYILHHGTVSPMGPLSDICAAMQGWSAGSAASVAWPAANLAIGYPFQVNETVTVYGAWYAAGATAGGNLDIGVYNLAGTRVASTGTTARVVSVHTEINITDFTLTPGHYYAAMSADGTNNYAGWTLTAAGNNEAQGMVEAATSFVLPSTITWSRSAQVVVPYFGFNFYSVSS